MWSKLEDYYNDTSASVQAALEGLIQLKRVNSEDYRGLIALVDEVEASYSHTLHWFVLHSLQSGECKPLSQFTVGHKVNQLYATKSIKLYRDSTEELPASLTGTHQMSFDTQNISFNRLWVTNSGIQIIRVLYNTEL